MEADRLDIHEAVEELCRLLDLEPKNVKRLVVEPTLVTADVFLVNERGSKYVDQATGKPAKETRTFEVMA